MALVMSPMSTAAMNSVEPEKAGVASGILSMSRMVGATFGVAAIGALFQHLARTELADKLAGTGVDRRPAGAARAQPGRRRRAATSLSAAGRRAPRTTRSSTRSSNGMWLSAGVAALGAVLAFVLIAPKTANQPEAARRPEAAAEVVTQS